MIVSTATADLPVWRSPMISSRWPRPIGTIESIDFRPVCTGCDTDCRAITPGATFSITSLILALIGPLPSMGWPSAFTTRPISSGPTGTSRMRPVHLTVSPSEMCSYSPRITAPTESRSRFSARPNVGTPSLVGEFQHFAGHRIGQAVDAADAVGHGDHRALVADVGGGRQALDPALDQFAN